MSSHSKYILRLSKTLQPPTDNIIFDRADQSNSIYREIVYIDR